MRVVQSAKDRTFAVLEQSISNIKNAMKIQDYAVIQEQFDAFAKHMKTAKTKTILEAHGGVPTFVVHLLVDVEAYFDRRKKDKASVRKLSAKQGRAFHRMVLTLRRFTKEYEELMGEARVSASTGTKDVINENDDDENNKSLRKKTIENDSDDDSRSETDSGTDSDIELDTDPETDSDTLSSDEDRDSDSDSVDSMENWSSADSSSSDSSSDQVFSQLKGRDRWLKKTVVTKEKVVKDKEGRGRARAEARAAAAAARADAAKEASLSSLTTKSIIPEQDLTASTLNHHVRDLISSRGRRGTDAKHLLRQLEALVRLSIRFGAKMEVPLLMHVITARFDLVKNLDDVMSTKDWKSAVLDLSRLVALLEGEGEENKDIGAPKVQYKLGMASREDIFDSTVGLALGGKSKGTSVQDTTDRIESMDTTLMAPNSSPSANNPSNKQVEEHTQTMSVKESHKMATNTILIPVNGSLALLLTRLDEEYVKSLQRINPHTAEYVLRLRDESKLVQVLMMAQFYFERVDMTSEAAEMSALRVEHLYYRHDSLAEEADKEAALYQLVGECNMVHPAAWVWNTVDCPVHSRYMIMDVMKVHPGAVNEKTVNTYGNNNENENKTLTMIPDVVEENDDPKTHVQIYPSSSSSETLLNDLCTYVYQHGKDRSRTRAMLCHIFHHALHDRFLEGRDLLLMSHLQDTISNVNDISTMILFNRMMVVLGLSAFRLGRIREAHQCLADICSGRARELLAQGMSSGRYAGEKTVEEEKAEKRRQIPYHQHIHLDLLEACHLTSAMLLEVPNMAAVNQPVDATDAEGTTPTVRRKVISRTFRKHYDIYDRLAFKGPPEQTRDFVIQAANYLLKGEWEQCAYLLSKFEVWQLVPGENAALKIQTMLLEKIKQEGLRTYILAYSAQYDSLSIQVLCELFALPMNEVHSIVSKMMINRELHASWDQTTETIVLRRVEPTSLQLMALQYAEKTSSLVEANERLLEAKRALVVFSGRDFEGGGGWNTNWKSSGDHYHQSRGSGRGGSGHHGYGQRKYHRNSNYHQRGTGNTRRGQGGRATGAYSNRKHRMW